MEPGEPGLGVTARIRRFGSGILRALHVLQLPLDLVRHAWPDSELHRMAEGRGLGHRLPLPPTGAQASAVAQPPEALGAQVTNASPDDADDSPHLPGRLLHQATP